jgi:hypothetical protein
MEKLLAQVGKKIDQLQKQLDFHPSKDLFIILDEKVHFHFTFPSKHVIVTNYNCICDFINYVNIIVAYVTTIVTYMTTQIYD